MNMRVEAATLRSEARARGEKMFYTGRLCKHGHVAERYVSHGCCKLCYENTRSRYNKTEKAKITWRRHEGTVRRRARRHGITEARYVALIEAQKGCCALCQQPLRNVKRFVQIDHDHRCCASSRGCDKCVRGLLCRNCNTALGGFKDSPELLRKAAEYVEAAIINRSKT